MHFKSVGYASESAGLEPGGPDDHGAMSCDLLKHAAFAFLVDVGPHLLLPACFQLKYFIFIFEGCPAYCITE